MRRVIELPSAGKYCISGMGKINGFAKFSNHGQQIIVEICSERTGTIS